MVEQAAAIGVKNIWFQPGASSRNRPLVLEVRLQYPVAHLHDRSRDAPTTACGGACQKLGRKLMPPCSKRVREMAATVSR